MTRKAAILPALLLLAVSGPAAAGKSEEARFDKLIAKYATSDADVFFRFKPRVACACKDALPAQPGFVLREEATGALVCAVPSFSNGDLMSYGPCQDFIVLTR